MLLTVTEETCNLNYIRSMIAFYRLRGVILPGNHYLYNLARELDQLQVPAVTINTKLNPHIPDVSTDLVSRGELAANYLLNKGHGRLGIISMANDAPHQQISKGFIETVKRHLPHEKVLHWEYKYEQESIIHAVNTILRGSEPPTALYFVSSDLVRLFYPLILNSKLRIPEDVSIVSSEEKNELQGLGITTFIQPTRQIGEAAAKLLFQQCSGQVPIQNETFSCKLRERSSVSDRNTQALYNK
jgi:DNA-binding LacI/PurR family transcriptional regulator